MNPSQDHLGSASVMMGGDGSLWGGTAARYKPFGGYAGDTPANYIQNRGFTGHDRTQADDALGVVYMNARVYMPGIGKFLTPDTLVPDPANSQSYNRYAYVHNNPINSADPSGHVLVPSYGATTQNLTSMMNQGLQDLKLKKLTKDRPREMCSSNPALCPPFTIERHFVAPNLMTGMQWFGATNFADGNPDYAYCGGNNHCGMDFIVPAGTTVYAGVHGEVVFSDCNGFFAPCYVRVLVKGTDGKDYYVTYGHLDKTGRVIVGAIVTPDTVIGKVGDYPGDPDHLHVEIHSPKNTIWYNPIHFYAPQLRSELYQMAVAWQNDPAYLAKYPNNLTFWQGTLYTQPRYICYTSPCSTNVH